MKVSSGFIDMNILECINFSSGVSVSNQESLTSSMTTHEPMLFSYQTDRSALWLRSSALSRTSWVQTVHPSNYFFLLFFCFLSQNRPSVSHAILPVNRNCQDICREGVHAHQPWGCQSFMQKGAQKTGIQSRPIRTFHIIITHAISIMDQNCLDVCGEGDQRHVVSECQAFIDFRRVIRHACKNGCLLNTRFVAA